MKTVRIMIFTMVFLLLFNIFSIGGAALTTSKINQEDYNKFIDTLETDVPKLMKRYGVPGTAIAVVHNGEISWSKGFGYANKKVGVSVDTETIFQVASISKTVSAWGIMKLVEEGKIDLDAPIEKYLTRWNLPLNQYSQYNDDITVRRLLSHTAGLSVGGYAGYKDLEMIELEDSLEGKPYKGYRVFSQIKPGTRFMYSGGGYTLLQLIVEEVSGKSFEEYMKEEILLPLGMKNSSFKWSTEMQSQLSKPYGVFGETLPNFLFAEKAAAGLYTTVEDLTTFLLASMGDAAGNRPGANVLNADTVRMMVTKSKLKSDSKVPYGLGYFIDKLSNKDKIIYHGGDNIGWRALMIGNPAKGEGLVILTNSYKGNHLINEVNAKWVAYQTGVEAGFIRNIKANESKLKMVGIVLLTLFFGLYGRMLHHLKSGKRKPLLKQNLKYKWLKWVQFSSGILFVLGWWIGLYAPWYQGGWTIAAFLPLGSGWITTVVTVGGLYFAVSGLFPKEKKKKNKDYKKTDEKTNHI